MEMTMRSFAVLGLVSLTCVGNLGCDAGHTSATEGTGGGGASGTTTSTSDTTTIPVGDAGNVGNCGDTSAVTGTLAQQYGVYQLNASANKNYILQSNWWHMYAGQTEAFTGLSFTMKNPNNAAVPTSDNAPMGFPSFFIGAYGGHTTMGSNLPKAVSALTSVPTIFKTNNSAISTSNHNATYDVWFTANNTPLSASQSNPGTGGAYLMVWLFKPTDRQPRGNDQGRRGLTITGVPGAWDVWVDTTNPPCVSYVSSTPIDALGFDLNDFIQDAVAKSYGVTSSMYLSIVFAGFEVWGNSDGLQVEEFCASVE
jgi:hypothetical protein